MSPLSNNLSNISSATRKRLATGGRILVDGHWASPQSTLPVIDPSSGEQVSTVAVATGTDIDAAVDAARNAMTGEWSRLAPARREQLMLRWAELIERDADLLAEIESIDVGMPYWMARHLNVEGALATIRYMAGWPTKIAGRTPNVGLPIPGANFFGFTTKEPVGVVAAILPWNVPIMLAAWKMVPALAAGCSLVLKPSEIAGLSVEILAELALEAGIPAGVINLVTGPGRDVGAALAAHPGVDKISFTGSTATGQAIAIAAAKNTTKVSLELGGKSPQLVFADANLEKAIPDIANAIFLNSGQICVAGSRIYVERSIFDETVERFSRWADSLEIGPGLAEATKVGPLASAAQKERVARYVAEARKAGASVTTNGEPVDAPGYYVRPTVLGNVHNDMQVIKEEVFGPVATVMPFDDLDEAVSLANATQFGLSACVWTSDLSTAHSVAPRIRAGKVAINTDPIPYPALPEGGRQASGYGRELSEEGLAGYLETKSVLIKI